MQNAPTIPVDRTEIAPHALARTPYNQIAAFLSLALFIAVLLSAGWTWLLVTFIVWVIALLVAGAVFARRAVAKVAERREADRQAHASTLVSRRGVDQFRDTTYEEQSAELAARFGRVEQTVPRHATPAHAHRVKHAAELVAQGVLRMSLHGRPVTAFDLEVANEVDLARLSRKTTFEQAFTLSTCYLTVCAVTLPFPLPYLSILAAFGPGMTEALVSEVDEDEVGVPSELRHTDDPEFAALMLSVPAVRRAAHDLDLPWVISGDQLVSTVLTPAGLPVHSVLRRANALGELAKSFPWDRLEAHRRDTVPTAPWPLHRSPLITYQSWLTGDLLGHGVLRWSHRSLGDDIWAFQGTPVELGDPR
ncbi:hypothetical protein [Lentzea sp. NPDC051838]|uniref:hypothetical protein n=1 Tax=Lentzea sp. NPDC051838 TaxID=3154849 RepID=UPI0034248DFF